MLFCATELRGICVDVRSCPRAVAQSNSRFDAVEVGMKELRAQHDELHARYEALMSKHNITLQQLADCEELIINQKTQCVRATCRLAVLPNPITLRTVLCVRGCVAQV